MAKSTAMNTKLVPISALAKNPIQSELRCRGIPKLALNLRTYGQLQAITVTRQGAPSGKYIIVDGHHRVAAARLLGWSQISATIDGADAELAYMAANGNTQRFTDRHGFESWARSPDPNRLLAAHPRALFVRDVRTFIEIVGTRRARELALAGVASPNWARHARTVYNLFQERTTGELSRRKQNRIRSSAAEITEAQILEWIVRHHGSNVAANLNKAVDLTKQLNELARRITANRPFPQRDWK